MAIQEERPDLIKAPLRQVLRLLRLDRQEVSSIYFYAILSGLIQLSLPLGIQSIINFVITGAISTSLVILVTLVVAGVFLTGLIQVNQMKLIEKVQQKIFTRYAFEFAGRLPRIKLDAVDGYYMPELTNRFFDVIILQKSISKVLLDIPLATIQIFFGLLLLSFYNTIFIFFGLLLLLISFLMIRLTINQGMYTSISESNYKYAVAGWLQEVARVVRSFKLSRNTSLHMARTDALTAGYLKSRTKHFRILLVQYWSLIGFKVLITASMLIVGSFLLVRQQINIGQFIAAEIVIITVISSVEKLVLTLDKLYDILTSADKLSKITDLPLEENGSLPLEPPVNGLSVEMGGVSFDYSNDRKGKILNAVALNIAAGQKVCIMGSGGSGKSTLLRLMSGAYDNYEGIITINGISIKNYERQSLRSVTGILLSQQDIFAGTLMENITMGNTAVHLADIMELAGRIGLKDFIAELKDGFNTHLDPMGQRLPRKMVQKILLLRALVNGPRLLLLEEPFEGMEPANLQLITDYLLHKTSGQTVVVTSNDRQFAAGCDLIIYLDHGTVAFSGNWSAIQNQLP
jgi:ATP-binding cassette, subfamily B, bacterial